MEKKRAKLTLIWIYIKWDTKNILCSKDKSKHKTTPSKTGRLVMHAKTLSILVSVI